MSLCCRARGGAEWRVVDCELGGVRVWARVAVARLHLAGVPQLAVLAGLTLQNSIDVVAGESFPLHESCGNRCDRRAIGIDELLDA